MAHRRIGQERLGYAASRGCCSSLDELFRLINWDPITLLLKADPWQCQGRSGVAAAGDGQGAAAVGLVRSVGCEAGRSAGPSFRRFCGFSNTEPTPERTAFVRFRKALVSIKLDRALFEAVTLQLKAKAVRVKTGTIVDATIIPSASEGDDDARWVKHKGKPAVHGFKAHVGADADTALVEEVVVTPANVNDGRAGPEALPDAPGEVFADSAYRGAHFREAVCAKGGTPRIAVTAMWGLDEQETLAKLAAFNAPIHQVRGRIEKIFGTWKRSYGLRRMRWTGIAKATAQVYLTAIAYNLKRMLTLTATPA